MRRLRGNENGSVELAAETGKDSQGQLDDHDAGGTMAYFETVGRQRRRDPDHAFTASLPMLLDPFAKLALLDATEVKSIMAVAVHAGIRFHPIPPDESRRGGSWRAVHGARVQEELGCVDRRPVIASARGEPPVAPASALPSRRAGGRTSLARHPRRKHASVSGGRRREDPATNPRDALPAIHQRSTEIRSIPRPHRAALPAVLVFLGWDVKRESAAEQWLGAPILRTRPPKGNLPRSVSLPRTGRLGAAGR